MHFFSFLHPALVVYAPIQSSVAKSNPPTAKQLSHFESPIQFNILTSTTYHGLETLETGLHTCHELGLQSDSTLHFYGYADPAIEFSLVVFEGKGCERVISGEGEGGRFDKERFVFEEGFGCDLDQY